ncbi:MAG: serine hydrolase domain-containing protein [Bacteroidota bacterium]
MMPTLPRLLVLLLPLVLLMACQTPEDPPIDHEARMAQIETALRPLFTIQGEPPATTSLAERMETLGVPGVSIAVIEGGEVAWARGYGFADVEAERPVTPQTLFQAASISKPVAATAALRLAQEGRLDLDTDVNAYLTSWQVPDTAFTATEAVTIRRLVNHTAGTTVWGFPGYAPGEPVPSTADVLDGSGNTDPVRVYKTPGESWRYSGGGYTVMQLALHDLTTQPFPALMDSLILTPLGMTASTYQQPLPADRHEQAAVGYRADGTAVEGRWHTYPEMAAAGLWTTPTDLARYALAIQQAHRGTEGSILDAATTSAMLTPGFANHGLGPVISTDTLRFEHGGANEGYRCFMTASIEGDHGMVVMTNSDEGGRLGQEIAQMVAHVYGWAGPQAEEKTTTTLDAAAYEAVAGRYMLEDGRPISVVYTADTLRIQADFLLEEIHLVPQSDTTFFNRFDGMSVVFSRTDGAVTDLLVANQVSGTRVE